MLVHGGISEEGEYLNDSVILSFVPLKWHHCVLSKYIEIPDSKDLFLFNPELSSLNCAAPALAYHSCCLVLQSEVKVNNKFNIYKYPDIAYNFKKINNQIKERGVYIFGGKYSDYRYNREVYCLKIGKKPVEWRKLNCFGKAPPPRILCSMEFCEDANLIVIHGGRYDINATQGSPTFKNKQANISDISDDFAFNDLWILELSRLEWTKVPLVIDGLNSIKVFNRCGHSSFIVDKRLYIFGGINAEGYIGSHIFYIDLYNKTIKKKNNRKSISLKTGDISI